MREPRKAHNDVNIDKERNQMSDGTKQSRAEAGEALLSRKTEVRNGQECNECAGKWDSQGAASRFQNDHFRSLRGGRSG